MNLPGDKHADPIEHASSHHDPAHAPQQHPGGGRRATHAFPEQIIGLRITPTAPEGLTANIDTTIFYTPDAFQTVARLGIPGYTGLDWAAGPVIQAGDLPPLPLVATSTTVNGKPARAYRGSFSHTYGFPNTFSVWAGSACCAAPTVATGNPGHAITGSTYSTMTFPIIYDEEWFDVGLSMIHADGFESGDFGAWSLVVP